MLFRKSSTITKEEIKTACNTEPSSKEESNHHVFIENLLDQFDRGEADFWSDIHQPLSSKNPIKAYKHLMTRVEAPQIEALLAANL